MSDGSTKGYVYICDRKKEMIKYKGFSLRPRSWNRSSRAPGCRRLWSHGSRRPEAGELPKAFIVPRAGCETDFDALARFVAERVAGYKQIRQFEVVDAIPRNPSGKILRRLLRQ
jgi:long-chain acyl-CoA synthetase